MENSKRDQFLISIFYTIFQFPYYHFPISIMFNIINKKRIFFTISGAIILVGIVSFFVFKLNLGIDFQGGTLWELKFSQDIDNGELRHYLQTFDLGEIRVRESEEGKMLKFRNVSPQERERIFGGLSQKFGEVEELSFETIGPVIGKEVKEKAILALILAAIAIILYVAWAFRKVSKPVSSWQFGITAIITLIHDILIMLTVFIILGKFWDVEINLFFITALLAVLGYSVNDTIVVFDRIRERLKTKEGEPFETLVNKSVNETLVRSLNTSLTTLFVLFALLLFGSESIRFFIVALIVGVAAGTYSSIFIASPFLTIWYNLQRRRV